MNTCCRKKPYLWWPWASFDCQGKVENFLWKSENSNVTFWWWLKTCEVIYQIYFWGDQFQILQNITSTYQVSGKVRIWYLALSYNFWEQQNCTKLRKNDHFDYYFVRCVLSLRLVVVRISLSSKTLFLYVVITTFRL